MALLKAIIRRILLPLLFISSILLLIKVLPLKGAIALGILFVRGLILIPLPAAKITACFILFFKLDF